jgi:putative ABC transport system permease protein
MKLFLLAFRSLIRNRRRTLSTIFAIAIGLTTVLLFGGYRSNIIYSLETGLVQAEGHLQIQERNYFFSGQDNPIQYGIADYDQIVDSIYHDPTLSSMVAVITPTLHLGGLIGNFSSGASRSVLARGLVASDVNKMLDWNDYHMYSYAKPLPLKDENLDEVVVGEGVGRKLNLCKQFNLSNCVSVETQTSKSGPALPDDLAKLVNLSEGTSSEAEDNTHIEMLAATSGGAPNVVSLNVIATRNMGMKTLDDNYLLMNLEKAQKLTYGSTSPKVTSINLQLKHSNQIAIATERLQNLLSTKFPEKDLAVLNFEQLNPSYGQTVQFMNSIFGFISVLISTIVLFTITSTMSNSIIERTVEIGTLRAIGLKRSELRTLFLFEGLQLGILGALFGLLTTFGVSFLVNHSGLTWIGPGYSYAYLILLRIWQDPVLLFGSVVSLIALTTLSALWPANRASQMLVVDALRHV